MCYVHLCVCPVSNVPLSHRVFVVAAVATLNLRVAGWFMVRALSLHSHFTAGVKLLDKDRSEWKSQTLR